MEATPAGRELGCCWWDEVDRGVYLALAAATEAGLGDGHRSHRSYAFPPAGGAVVLVAALLRVVGEPPPAVRAMLRAAPPPPEPAEPLAAASAGALIREQKMCESCGLNEPKYGLTSEGKARWCAGCGKKEGAVRVMLEAARAPPRSQPTEPAAEASSGAPRVSEVAEREPWIAAAAEEQSQDTRQYEEALTPEDLALDLWGDAEA
jgi:hypothetical protein